MLNGLFPGCQPRLVGIDQGVGFCAAPLTRLEVEMSALSGDTGWRSGRRPSLD